MRLGSSISASPSSREVLLRLAALTVCAAVLCLAGLISGARSQEAVAPVAGYEEIAERLRGLIGREVDVKGLPAFSIALVDGERVVWAEGFGFQDGARQKPASAATVYRVGSVSKLFTDIAVMQLVERGELALDADVTEYLPDFRPTNPFDRPITLRQLMSHRSGLVRESPVGHYFDPTEPTIAATVASLNSTSLVYRPETKTKYSNAGITVVGHVLEQMTGRPFARQLDEALLSPLGMQGSGFRRTPAIDENLATAWMWTYDGRRFEAPEFALGTLPAGNLYSSVNDLSKFLIALFGGGKGEHGRIFTADTLRQMTSPASGASQFGIGFHIEDFDGHRKIGHGGAVYGFSTQLEALPDEKLGVVAVASLDGAGGVVGRIADFALRLLLAKREGKPLPNVEATSPVPHDVAREVAGRYASGEKLIELTEDNGRLFMRRGSFRYEIRSLGEELVVDDVLAYGPKVTRDGADVLVVDGVRYERLADARPQPAPVRWEGLIGEYGWDHNTLYILEDRGQLVALIEWFYYYPLEELSENEFAFPDYGLYHGEKLDFTRDANGAATQVVAAEVTFPRRSVGTLHGETFRIDPVRPIDEVRAGAMAAEPPEEDGEFRNSELVDLAVLDPTIRLDIRYATTNNFMGAVFYDEPRAFMQRPAAEAVVRAHNRLKAQGYGLLIHDAYRPWYVTKMFWDATPDGLKDFVADPASGSRHNRGCAIDLTLYDLATGEPAEMVAGYDEFSTRSYPAYPGGTSRQRWHRKLLRQTMEAEGFTIYEFEWWHFDYKDWRAYGIENVSFDQIDQ